MSETKEASVAANHPGHHEGYILTDNGQIFGPKIMGGKDSVTPQSHAPEDGKVNWDQWTHDGDWQQNASESRDSHT